MPRQLRTKPGAERAPFRPDVILDFSPTADTPLLEFLLAAMSDRKRTTVKDFLKHRQVMVNGNVTTQFDMPLTAIEDFREKGKSDPLFARLADCCDAHDGLWNSEAEAILFRHFHVI